MPEGVDKYKFLVFHEAIHLTSLEADGSGFKKGPAAVNVNLFSSDEGLVM